MTLRAKLLIAFALFVLLTIVTSISFALYYRGNAINYKAQRDTATSNLKQANDSITDMQTRQRDVAAIDAKYTKELADAKAKLDSLQQCLRSGKCGLRLNATCPKDNASGTASMDDAASARLTDAAQRNYFTLRERIEVVGKQVTSLQQYIRNQCIR
ncbi:lysis protein [Pantoea agglomerans]|uniref:lysis protein n=1 Tax=Enterobacter agglomerans TaxID=549 RepID=UPI003FD43620